MTSEVLIMNSQAIALAADSAVTANVGGSQKIFTSANKIFALSRFHPVGIMNFGNSHFMGIPIETIIKTYRKKLGKKSFESIEGYANDFFQYLETLSDIIDEDAQRSLFDAFSKGFLKTIVNDILTKIDSMIKENGNIHYDKIIAVGNDVLTEHHKGIMAAPLFPSIPNDFAEILAKMYYDNIEKNINEKFEKFPLSDESKLKVKEIVNNIFVRDYVHPSSDIALGIVIAGFGEKELFPSYREFIVSGMIGNRIIYRKNRQAGPISTMHAFVSSFAQGEMVHMFMEGVDEEYQRKLENDLYSLSNALLNKSLDTLGFVDKNQRDSILATLRKNGELIITEFKKNLSDFRRTRYTNPVTNAVIILPKEELAILAESLVNLTSLKRKVSINQKETVGGPIDVALISKGDGFIWIKRKYYFDRNLNPHFDRYHLIENEKEDKHGREEDI